MRHSWQLKTKPHGFTREEVAFILELLSEGVKRHYIAEYIYGITTECLYERLKVHGVYDKGRRDLL